MLKRKVDLDAAIDVVLYGRMSTDLQNPRSPDQQFNEIIRTMNRLRRPWNVVDRYRDDGISGRLVRKRHGLMSLIKKIKIGTLKVKAILVDTYERWGRTEEMETLRRQLWLKHGVLLLTADAGFVDPTTPAGRALSKDEQTRAIEANHAKAHDVLRGKRDAALQKHWPGGPPPFGYKLDFIMIERSGRPEVDYSRLVPNPETEWIIKRIFRMADRFELGISRLAKLLNKSRRIPDSLKPIHPSTVGHWLQNPIYYGELVWAQNCTGYIDETRVVDPNPPEDHVRVTEFCEPLVERALWDSVQKLRQQRAAAIAQRRNQGSSRMRGSGMTLKYPLSGLVRCECGASMNPCSSGGTNSKYHYVYYGCPRYAAGGCTNATKIREDHLWKAVVSLIRQHLLPIPDPGPDGLIVPPLMLEELANRVRIELEKLRKNAPDRAPGIRLQIEKLQQQRNGWLLSLGDTTLSSDLRKELQKFCDEAMANIVKLKDELQAIQNQKKCVEAILDLKTVLARLKNLDEVLKKGGPTRINMELSLHIKEILVSGDRTVTLYSCPLGLFEGAVEHLRGPESERTTNRVKGHNFMQRVVPRTRPRMQPEDEQEDGLYASNATDSLHGPHHFEGLDPKWFWTDQVVLPKCECWSSQHAQEIATLRQADPKRWTMAALAQHFGVTIPTIRKGLRTAAKREEKVTEPQ